MTRRTILSVLAVVVLLVLVMSGCWLLHPVVTPEGVDLSTPPLATVSSVSATATATKIYLEFSLDRVEVQADRAMVTGRVFPPEAKVEVGDQAASVDTTGRFTATVRLAMGVNFIPVVATWGNQQRMEIVQARRMAATEGESATLGGVEFSLVSAVLTDTVGAEPLVVYARGRFLVVKVSVRNNRQEPVSLWDEEFVLQDGDNRSYRVSTEGSFAWRSAAGEDMSFCRVSPGTEAFYTLVFDVPSPLPEGLILRAYSTVESWAAEMAVPVKEQ